MTQTYLENLASDPRLDTLGNPLRDAVHGVYDRLGPAGRTTKNALHGVWLGHPLHPVLTDVPIGAWTAALVLDAMEAATNDRGYGRGADVALAVGLAGAAGAAVTGLTDWSETDGRARRIGLVHGLLNASATTLMATSLSLRRNGSRGTGRALAWLGYGIAGIAAYLGGSLIYRERIGVTHAAADEPEEFTKVLESSALPDNSMRKATIGEGTSVLLVRQQGKLFALSHSCAHLGGPLSEGTLKDGSVVCPWHGSEFALADGRVLNGPATESQPTFDVEEREGYIAVRVRTTPSESRAADEQQQEETVPVHRQPPAPTGGEVWT